MSDREIIDATAATGYYPRIVYSRIGTRVIRYLKIGSDSLPKLICLHGSPSSLSAWRALFEDTRFLKHYQVIAIDRPGYGYSDFGDVEANIQRQVQILQPLIDSITENGGATIMGASYGGPVAVQLVMNRPDKFSQLVLLSASLQPGMEKTYWFSHLMAFPLIGYAFPETFRMASEEKIAHASQLETLGDWMRIRSKVLIIHGNKDALVYYDNAIFAKRKLQHAAAVKLVTMNGKGHAIIFRRPDFIRKILLENLEN